MGGISGAVMMIGQKFNRRHSPNRRKTRVPAVLRLDGATCRATIMDVSFQGIRLSVPLTLESGTPVTVEACETAFPAIVHWCENGQAGLHLLKRLDREVLIALETADDELAEYR